MSENAQKNHVIYIFYKNEWGKNAGKLILQFVILHLWVIHSQLSEAAIAIPLEM